MFSRIRQPKTHRRNNMADERLSVHALLHLKKKKKEFVKRICLAILVDKFNSEHENRKNSPTLGR